MKVWIRRESGRPVEHPKVTAREMIERKSIVFASNSPYYINEQGQRDFRIRTIDAITHNPDCTYIRIYKDRIAYSFSKTRYQLRVKNTRELIQFLDELGNPTTYNPTYSELVIRDA